MTNPFEPPRAYVRDAPARPGVPYLWTAYFGWVGCIVVATATSIASGDFHQVISQTKEASRAADRDTMIAGIMIVGIVWALVMMLVAAFLVAFANRARPWAALLLSAFCGYQIWEGYRSYQAFATFGIPLDLTDLVVMVASFACMAYLAVAPHVPALRRRHVADT